MRGRLTLAPLSATFIILFVGSCKTPDDSSRLRGHYENLSEAELIPYKGKVKIIPEFEDSSGVIITVDAVEKFNLYPLLEAFKQHPQKPSVILPMLSASYPEPAEMKPFLNDNQFKVINVKSDPNAVYSDISWTRDWAPWPASYKPDVSTPPKARFADFNYYEVRNLADEVPQLLSTQLGIPRISIPIRTEGGNFMINNRGDCMMTTGVIDREELVKKYKELLENYRSLREDLGGQIYEKLVARYEMLLENSKSYDRAAIEAFFMDYAGCRKVFWLPPSPADVNQHIDLFAKFLSEDIVLVMDLQDATIATLPKVEDPAAELDVAASLKFAKNVQSNLNEVAGTLTRNGFRVVRAPLPLTMIYKALFYDESARLPLIGRSSGLAALVSSGSALDLKSISNAGLEVHMRSYANSLIVKPMVYVPRFNMPIIDGSASMAVLGGDGKGVSEYPDAALIPQYEKAVVDAYRQAGLTVTWIDADQTVPFQGSIHCLTQQIGRVPNH